MKIRLILLTLMNAGVLSAGIVMTVNPGNTITGLEGNSIGNTLLTTFDDGATTPGPFSATIDWGDSTTSAPTSITFVSGDTYDVFGSHTYAEEGSYVYTVSVDDTGNSISGDNTGTASISDAPLTPGSPINGSGMPLLAIGGLIGTFTDGNPDSPLSDFSATINWGDGTPTTLGTVTQPGGVGTTFDVGGDHTYAADGSYGVTVTINDVGGSSTTDTATEQITPEPGTFVFCGTGLLFGYAALRFRHKTMSRS